MSAINERELLALRFQALLALHDAAVACRSAALRGDRAAGLRLRVRRLRRPDSNPATGRSLDCASLCGAVEAAIEEVVADEDLANEAAAASFAALERAYDAVWEAWWVETGGELPAPRSFRAA